VTKAGVPLRYRLIGSRDLMQAITQYESGKSLASVADQLGVAVNTVRSALVAAGVEMRDSHGRER
jgi:hypothetical protein